MTAAFSCLESILGSTQVLIVFNTNLNHGMESDTLDASYSNILVWDFLKCVSLVLFDVILSSQGSSTAAELLVVWLQKCFTQYVLNSDRALFPGSQVNLDTDTHVHLLSLNFTLVVHVLPQTGA